MVALCVAGLPTAPRTIGAVAAVELDRNGGEPDSALLARERILRAAYDLFSHHGIQAVGIDAIITRAGVARPTLYRNFSSKEDLVLAFLERRDELWTRSWLQQAVEGQADDPSERLMAIFDVFDEWFRAPDFEGCSFINVLLEHPDPAHAAHRASASYLAGIRSFVEGLARRAGVAKPADFARQWHLLMKGAIVAACEGDKEAAQRAKELGSLLLRHSRPE
jgi:AcrR family transcriptional regulator